ncbi:glutamate receptor-interacting protein 2 isoform X2 [Toxorhynchites rutilus septentrionalis]|uniref:glutamate receptor-interacting protein 2 isoform X2 n=1 Tax=Toxorhynchites rutilus septentrionalis TaxID=329112 RepID=UPI00247A1E0D|nr:glutamate receptor-interacting protein 2 isoform X2 [Toxorhynchites rutilus septentrionalis]XP_055615896.1 glutamate receptor-interacting protein 2 isoform X2 [Toxorhynchites rutilus septentrionalis]XP_055615897.1 glutamate receptor-interacting protein 2 isoform X2 [Toxorhynchites rutilus septentrionalis]XP_055615898.1 glutamate receptor-interacting protein 2 isoform X2 [Toxorhynchites rutilus septentrionalis]XP_055615899.1 glutamate receptor-interacting protein 2 isoform X2 [Toxorhynchites 
MKLWKSKKCSSGSGGNGTSCVTGGSGGGKGGTLSKSCNFNSHSSSNNSFEDNSVETSFINPTATGIAGGGTGTAAVTTAGTPAAGLMPSSGGTSGSILSAIDRAMSPAQSEDSGLAADRGTTYATITIPRDQGQPLGIILAERTDLSYPPAVESISGPAADFLAPGDRIHQIDGISTIGLTNQHLFSILAHGDGSAVVEIEYSYPEYISQNSLCVTTKLAQITVERENGCLGLTLRGGGEYPLIVTNVRMHGPVFKTGQIKPGDRVLRVDNISLMNKTLTEAQHILKNGHLSGYTNLTIEYDVSVMQSVEFSMGPLLLEIERPMNEKLGLILSNYSSAVNQNDIYHKLDEVQQAGIYIASILPASIADRCGALTVGDQILSVDETIVENSAYSPEEVTTLLDANCTKGYTQLQILPAHTLVRRRGITCSSPKYGFNTVDSRKNLASNKSRRLVRKSSLPQPAENGSGPAGTLHPNMGLCKAETIQLVLDCSQGSGICLGPKTPCGRGFIIAQVLPDSVAERSGCLQKGDRILAVNKMYSLDANTVRQLLGDFGPKSSANLYHNQPQSTNWVELELEFDMADSVIPSSGVFNIKLIRQNKCGLGITVNGNNHGSFVISEVKPGSAAHRTGSLRAGDVLLAVDNHPVQHYNLDLLLKECKNDYITLTVKRNSLPDFLFDAQQKTNLIYGSTEDNAYIYGTRYNESPSLKSNNNVDYFQIEDHIQQQQHQQQQLLRRPMWNRPTTYDILPSGANVMTQSTGTLKAILHQQPQQQPPVHVSSSAENLPHCQNQLLGDGDEDRFDDIVHYKMASMNINSTNYVGLGNAAVANRELDDQIQQIIFSVRLEPNGGPLGITLAGSDDLQKPIKISGLTEGGVAHTNGQLQVGDCLLAINGESVRGVPLTTATKLLHKFENVVELQISRTECVGARSQGAIGNEPQPQVVYAKVQRRPRSPSITDALSTNSNASSTNCRTLHVTLFKDRVYDDYGFSVSDGLYERGVYINRIRSGGPADLVGMLRPFDRIVQVNGTKTQDFDCCLTVPLIAAAGDKIDLVLQRPQPE